MAKQSPLTLEKMMEGLRRNAIAAAKFLDVAAHVLREAAREFAQQAARELKERFSPHRWHHWRFRRPPVTFGTSDPVAAARHPLPALQGPANLARTRKGTALTQVNTSKSRGKKNVADLVERVSSLQGATEWWASVGLLMLIATAIIAVLTVGAQYMSIRKGRELNRAQNALAAAKDAKPSNLDATTSNRWLTTEEFKSLETAMGTFSGQPVEVVVFPVNFESVAIADLIHGILANAKWRVGPSATRLVEPAQLPTPAGMMSLMVQGVYIRSSGDYASRTAGRALYDALSTTVASGEYDPEPIPGVPRVFVLVGDKPTPLNVWIDK